MRRVLHEWRRFGSLILLACALLGWSAGRFGSGSSRKYAVPRVLPPVAPFSVSRQMVPPSVGGDGRGVVKTQPPRDPFDEAASASLVEPSDPWKGFDSLRLGAIWRQSDDSLAVIGGLVVRPGDSVGGFRLAHCGRDAVWITGPLGSRRLGFQPKTDPKPGFPRS